MKPNYPICNWILYMYVEILRENQDRIFWKKNYQDGLENWVQMCTRMLEIKLLTSVLLSTHCDMIFSDFLSEFSNAAFFLHMDSLPNSKRGSLCIFPNTIQTIPKHNLYITHTLT